MKLFFIIIITLVFSGCASFVNLKESTSISNDKNADYSSADELEVYVETVLISGGTKKIANNSGMKNDLYSQDVLVKDLEKHLSIESRRISHLSRRGSRLKFVLTDSILKEKSQRFFWGLSVVSLGIFPFYTTGEVLSEITFINDNESFSRSYKDKYLYCQHLLLLPLIFKSKKDAVISIGRSHFDLFVKELLEQEI